MSSQTNGCVVDALHQAAVAGYDICAMIDQIVTIDRIQMPLGDRHPDRRREPLPQRPRRRLDPRELEILRMPGARAVQLAAIADFVDRRMRVTREMQRSEEHTSELQSL